MSKDDRADGLPILFTIVASANDLRLALERSPHMLRVPYLNAAVYSNIAKSDFISIQFLMLHRSGTVRSPIEAKSIFDEVGTQGRVRRGARSKGIPNGGREMRVRQPNSFQDSRAAQGRPQEEQTDRLKMMSNRGNPVGFIGLGAMGEPMALNLVKAGTPLVVWNRSREKCEKLALAGAKVAQSPEEVLALCTTTIMMLVDGAAVDIILLRGKEGFARSVRGRLIVNMATTEPTYSMELQRDILAAGGRYVEAPVSGSRKPAESGQLVAMLAGSPLDLKIVRQLLVPLCRSTIECGAVPRALQMKLAVNLFLTAIVAGLAETVHFASSHQLDLSVLVEVLDAGPLASDVSRVKVEKMVARDFSVQASIANVLSNVDLIVKAARASAIASPILDTCHQLFRETNELGLGNDDMAVVIRAIEQRTTTLQK